MSTVEQRAAWWPIAFSGQVTARPMGAACAAIDAVIFRDHSGVVRSFVDRCAHRRAALSSGWLAPDGSLQCRYHGWCYDVETGICVDIPTYPRDPRSQEKVGVPRYKIQRFATAERWGLAFICIDVKTGSEPQFRTLWDDLTPHGRVQGMVRLSMTHGVFVEALLTQPEVVLRLKDPLFDLVIEKEPHSVTTGEMDNTVIVERYAQRKLPRVNFENPRSLLSLRTEIHRITGLARVTLRREDGPIEIEMLIGSRPILPYATEILWLVTRAHGPGRATVTAWRFGRKPVAVDLSAARPIPAVGLIRKPMDLWQQISPAAIRSQGT